MHNAETLTVSEDWTHDDRPGGTHSVRWTVRRGRTILTRVDCPMDMGMVDTRVVLSAVAEATGAPVESMRWERKRSDGHRVAPRLLHVTTSA